MRELNVLNQIIYAFARLSPTATAFPRLAMNNSQPTYSGSPLDVFQHCPHCGDLNLKQKLGKAINCNSCGFEFFFNCASAVAVFLFFEGKLILGERAKDPCQGMLDLPGGFVDFDESLEEALRREVLEELNLSLSKLEYICSAPNSYFYNGVLYKTTDACFMAEVSDISNLKAADDLAGYRIIAPDELNPEALAFPSSRNAFLALKDRLRLV